LLKNDFMSLQCPTRKKVEWQANNAKQHNSKLYGMQSGVNPQESIICLFLKFGSGIYFGCHFTDYGMSFLFRNANFFAPFCHKII
jgi:hypothetical protein